MLLAAELSIFFAAAAKEEALLRALELTLNKYGCISAEEAEILCAGSKRKSKSTNEVTCGLASAKKLLKLVRCNSGISTRINL